MPGLHERPVFHEAATCRFCSGELSARSVLCRGCGATLSRRAVSVWPLFLFLPLIAFASVLGVAVQMELPPRDLVIAFMLAWLALDLAYIVWTRRPTWRRGDTLLLTDGDTATGLRRWMTPLTSQWSMGATTAAIVGALWIASAGQPLETANAALVLPLDSGGKLAEAPKPPVAVAIVAPRSPEKAAVVAAVPLRIEPVRLEQPAAKPATAITTVAAKTVEPDASAAAAPAAGTPVAETAESKEQALILTAQKMLDGLGYSVGRIDGKPGSKTRIAVQSFREREGLGGGETIDASLVSALERATAQRRAAIQRARQQEASAGTSARPQDNAAVATIASPPPAAVTRPPHASDTASAPLRLRREASTHSSPVQSARMVTSDPMGY